MNNFYDIDKSLEEMRAKELDGYITDAPLKKVIIILVICIITVCIKVIWF